MTAGIFHPEVASVMREFLNGMNMGAPREDQS